MLAIRVPALILVAFALAGCGGRGPAIVDAPTAPALTLPAQLGVRVAGQIVTVPLEEYLVGTVLAETAPATTDTANTAVGIYRVQAIIARTYAVSHLGRHKSEGFDLCDATHCQVYQPSRATTSRFAGAARQGVADTRGQVLLFDGRPSEALFHADCGGHTADAALIWGGRPVAYLKGATDSVPIGTHQTWQFSLSRDAFRAALQASPLTDVGGTLTSVTLQERDPSGRVVTVELRGSAVRRVRGEQLRSVLNQTFGPRAIRSTRFSLTLAGDTYRFDGTGYGHGVGLCQVGVIARVRRGEAVAPILATYYPGTQLTPARPAPPVQPPLPNQPRPFPTALLESP
jgi:stage II sporulation protein D